MPFSPFFLSFNISKKHLYSNFYIIDETLTKVSTFYWATRNNVVYICASYLKSSHVNIHQRFNVIH
jgi:hypothetical protein